MKSSKELKKWWLMVLFSGLFLIGVGIWVLITPVQAYYSLSIVLAIGMVISGILNLIFALQAKKYLKGWSWLLAGSAIDIFLGAYLLYFPMLTMILLPIIIGLWLLFRGFIAIGGTLENDFKRKYGWFWPLFPGLLVILCSIIILDNPLMGVINIVSWTALAFIISGFFRLYVSLKMLRFK